MAHSRRKFYDAQLSDRARAKMALAMIGQLYGIEDEAVELSSAERRDLRQKLARPILDSFRIWLDEQVLVVLPKSPIGKAIQYARGHWQALTRYVDDGDLSIDNNQAENSLRNICLGRKNFLFYGSEGGGEWAAVIYSLIESAIRNGHDPFAYLADVLVRLPTQPIKQIAQLLPKNWKPPPPVNSS